MRLSIDDHNLLASIANAPAIATKAGHGDPTAEEMEAVHRAQAAIKAKARKHLEHFAASIDRREEGTPPTKLPAWLLPLVVAGVLAGAVGLTGEPRNDALSPPPVPHPGVYQDPWGGAGHDWTT